MKDITYDDVLEILSGPMVEWRIKVEALTYEQRTIVARAMDRLTVKAVRLRAYTEVRDGLRGSDASHEAGVEASNNLAIEIRKALGYNHPERMEQIHF